VSSTFSGPESSEQQREELAAIEGHDADIPTEVQGSSGVEGVHASKGHGSSVAAPQYTRSAAPKAACSTQITQQPDVTHDSTTPVAQEGGASNHDLAPSTIAQWVPSTATEATSSTAPEVAPTTAPEQTPSTLPEAAPSSLPKTAPSTAPEAASLSALEKVPSTAQQIAAFSAAEANPSSNGHAEKATLASSELEKEIDLEAGNRGSSSSEKEHEVAKTEVDPNIVDWDGKDDPQNPINWSEKLKWGNVAVIASITFLT